MYMMCIVNYVMHKILMQIVTVRYQRANLCHPNKFSKDHAMLHFCVPICGQFRHTVPPPFMDRINKLLKKGDLNHIYMLYKP